MKYNPKIHHRRSIRLKGYDYTRDGYYFITLCEQNREHLFGEIARGVMRRNHFGDIVADCWQWLAEQYPYVVLDEWVVMPNHHHGILVLTGETGMGGESRLGLDGSQTAPGAVKRKPLGRLIGAFKTISTKRVNEIRKTPGAKLWQRDFYEHIIRNESDLNRIRQYIRNNPMNWQSDSLFPK